MHLRDLTATGPPCLACHTPIAQPVSWRALLIPDKDKFCHACRSQLCLLPEGCPGCSHPLLPQETSCYSCRKWDQSLHWRGLINQNVAIYPYNDFCRNLVARWKYRGDAAIAEGFRPAFVKAYKRHFPDCLPVPIPLAPERLLERGFNQAEQLASFVGEPVNVLKRPEMAEKQSKTSYAGRLNGDSRPFVFDNHREFAIKDRHLLLIDDIYTTGATVRKAARPLLEAGAAAVSALTLARAVKLADEGGFV